MVTTMIRKISFFLAFALASTGIGAADLGSGFTYQGELMNNGAAADGEFDFQMKLFDVSNGGVPIGSAVIVDNATVTGGLFAVELDFGIKPFNGDQLWLEISVREGASAGGFTGLLPRQKLTATPFALLAEQVVPESVGTQGIITTQVQRRVTGSCAVGSYVRAVNENGTVSCADDVTNEAGIASTFFKPLGELQIESNTLVATVEIRVPSDGYVNVSVAGIWHPRTAGLDRGPCQLTMGTAIDDAAPMMYLTDGETSSLSYMGFSGHSTMPVSVADNPPLISDGQGINLVCSEDDGDVRIVEAHITAEFFPTSYAP